MEYNVAFIDGQNLHLWTAAEKRKIDFKKFRIYLKDKFNIQEAYYFLGFLSDEEQELYSALQKAGFIIIFREHSANLKWKKKGNVDVDIVFEIMKKLIEKEPLDKIVLVSGDWDYIKLVKYLVEKWLLKKILFPNNKYSSLYNTIKTNYGMTLSVPNIRKYLEHNEKKVS